MSWAFRRTGRAASAAVLVGALLTTGLAHSRIDGTASVSRGEGFLPRAEHAKLAALGFDPLLADFYWLRAVQLLGGTDGRVGEYARTLGQLVEIVTTLDPWVDHAYRFGAVWLTNSEEEVRWANRLLQRGVAYHPREWRNHYYLGFNHFFYLEENVRAAQLLEPAIGLPKAPAYLGSLVARLRSGRQGLETAAGFLAELAETTEDGFLKAAYLKALDEIETERRARFLDAAREAFERRHGRDIGAVAELSEGPAPLVRRLPPAHPVFDGFEWQLDDESGQIVSSFYGSRYELHIHPSDRKRRERWRAARERAQED